MADTVQQTVEKLVAANRILFGEGILDAYGHISVRSPVDPQKFLLARSMAPGLVTAPDILDFGPDGEPTDGTAPPVYLERFIHAAIYAARPDVHSVVHSHTEAVLPFGLSGKTKLRAVLQTCAFVGCNGAPVFEIRDVLGDDSNLMVTDMHSGAALARTLGDEALVLMRGHGMTVTGASVEATVFKSVFTAINARAQFAAIQLGDVKYLSPGEVGRIGQVKNPLRAWELWCDRYAP